MILDLTKVKNLTSVIINRLDLIAVIVVVFRRTIIRCPRKTGTSNSLISMGNEERTFVFFSALPPTNFEF